MTNILKQFISNSEESDNEIEVSVKKNSDDIEWVFHNDCIKKFNNKLYDSIFTKENIISKKKCISLDGQKFYGYFMEKGHESFFLLDTHFNDLPCKIIEATEVDYRGDVFKLILRVSSITIPSEQKLTFRELVDVMPAFQHSNPKHFLLYKILAITSYVDRVNARISTDAGFGKDSVVNIISHLVDSTVNIYGATFAKLEYSLINKLIILNELGNLKAEEKISMQEFLLAVGAYFNTYTKRTRKTSTTQEEYDVSKLSLLIFYNLPEYYLGKAQEYFDQIFTKAVINRFIPFVFEGRLTTQFEKMIDTDKTMEENEDVYKDVIASLHYYRETPVKDIKYEVDKSLKFSTQLKRYERSLNIILKWVAEYAETQEEFNDLSKELFKCYKKYETLLIKEKEMM